MVSMNIVNVVPTEIDSADSPAQELDSYKKAEVTVSFTDE